MIAMIIEDESFAQAQLTKTLTNLFPDITICAAVASVRAAVDYLKSNAQPDIIFMDVELSDGNSFEIFRQVNLTSKVIMTTAYDSYAIKAFEVGSIDYLLKPIEETALRRAVNRCRESEVKPDFAKILSAFSRKEKRLLVKLGDSLIPISLCEVAYFYSNGKSNFLMTRSGESYIVDNTIDQLALAYEADDFFRASRGCVVSRSSVQSLRHVDGRYLLNLNPPSPIELTVSRSKTDLFIEWLKSSHI